MINFLLKVWTAIEIIMWLKTMREKDNNDEDDLHERRQTNPVQPDNRSGRSTVLDDVPPKEKRH